jgi:hypothetical protein
LFGRIYDGAMNGTPPPPGGQRTPPEPAADADDAGLIAVRIQRRKRAWAVAMIWFLVAFFFVVGSASEASDDGTPAPAWFLNLRLVTGALSVVALAFVIGYNLAMRRLPPELQAQAVAFERQRLRARWRRGPFVLLRRMGWFLYLALFWLGMALIFGAAVLGVLWAINGAAYLAGASHAVRWAAVVPVHSAGDAAVSLIVGLLFVFAGAAVGWYLYRRATRVWWPRYLDRRATRY